MSGYSLLTRNAFYKVKIKSTTRFKKDGTLEIFNKTVTVKRVVKQFRLNIEQYM